MSLLGPLTLTVADLEHSVAFYANAIGLSLLRSEQNYAALGTAGGNVLIGLAGDSSAPRARLGATGLFHVALLVADRPALAQAARRLTAAGARLTGASDHLVSESLYLRDPEGNGIEIYRDRPREDWRFGPAGELEMTTLALDLDGVMAQLPAGGLPQSVADTTTIGHVHLHVQDLAAARRFYVKELGIDVMVESYPGALFLSKDGYHHHIALNIWSGRAGPPLDGALGLRSIQINRAGRDEALTDPSGNRVLLRAK